MRIGRRATPWRFRLSGLINLVIWTWFAYPVATLGLGASAKVVFLG